MSSSIHFIVHLVMVLFTTKLTDGKIKLLIITKINKHNIM